jgi:hypothetical protein
MDEQLAYAYGLKSCVAPLLSYSISKAAFFIPECIIKARPRLSVLELDIHFRQQIFRGHATAVTRWAIPHFGNSGDDANPFKTKRIVDRVAALR